jgi:dTDP-4-dehydrorhamnose reductase
MSAMRLLVTGAAGMLGTEVVAAAAARDAVALAGSGDDALRRATPLSGAGDDALRRATPLSGAGDDALRRATPLEVVALARADVDITDADAVRAVVHDVRPDVIVNCAAWTDVDGAEDAEDDATAINGDGAGHVAAAAAETGAHVVHLSTDYVFPGDATQPYREDAPTGPRSAYGRSKLAGEQAVAAAAPHGHAIVRTAWLFGPHGTNFVDTMLRLASQRPELNVVNDQLGCPTYAGHLARALVRIAEARTQGVLHVAGGGACTWYELACATFARAGVDVIVHPCTTAEFPRPAHRPAYSVLGSTRRDAPVLPPWQEGLAAHLNAREVCFT